MNTTELLDQFIAESREGLERIGRRLLDVERQPGDADLLNDLFRLVHTLKGNCGLFDFKPLEHVVHAAEDLLDRVRDGRRRYDDAIADALLAAMDCAVEMVDAIAAAGRLPDDAADRSRQAAGALRALLDGAAAPNATPDAPPAPAAAPALPDWVAELPEDQRPVGRVWVRYRPEPECFFKGEDPWRLAATAPGLVHLDALPLSPWPAPAEFDCYRCNLDLRIGCDAPWADVQEHFRYVPEQIEAHLVVDTVGMAPAPRAAASPGQTAVEQRLAALWLAQVDALAVPHATEGAVAGVRTTLTRLLAARADAGTAAARAALATIDAGPAALAQWGPPARARRRARA
jgi:two-component system, chemotaxis family, sensor kinase CheA